MEKSEDIKVAKFILEDFGMYPRELVLSSDGARYISPIEMDTTDRPTELERDLRSVGYVLRGPFDKAAARNYWANGTNESPQNASIAEKIVSDGKKPPKMGMH